MQVYNKGMLQGIIKKKTHKKTPKKYVDTRD